MIKQISNNFMQVGLQSAALLFWKKQFMTCINQFRILLCIWSVEWFKENTFRFKSF